MYTVRIFMERTHFCAPKQLKLLIEPDFHCLADEIAEPRPDMNVKVAAFTVSKKYINTKSMIIYTSCVCILYHIGLLTQHHSWV